jgi:hypothetical protein
MRFRELCCMTLSASLLCSCYNVVPTWPIDVAAPVKDTDVKWVEEVIHAQGFIPSTPTPEVLATSPGPAVSDEFGGQWDWEAHKSTYVILFRVTVKSTGSTSYRLFFVDGKTDGSELVGAPCKKYLEFISALKARFGAEQSRLRFIREACDPERQ